MRSLVSPTETKINPTALQIINARDDAIRAPRRVARIAILALKSRAGQGRAKQGRAKP